MTKLRYPQVIVDIVEEHFEELDFLWQQREAVIFAPDWDLEDLAELESRALAHLDGLSVGEGHAVDIARPALAGDDVFAAVAATLLFMELGTPELLEELLDVFECAEAAEVRDGIRIGLRHCRLDAARDRLLAMAAGANLACAAAAADVLAFQRVTAPEVARLLVCEDASVRTLALGALGRLRGLLGSEELERALADPDPAVERAGWCAAAMSGMPEVESRCRAAAMDGEKPSLEALSFLGVFGNPMDLALLQAAVRDVECAPLAMAALGALGRAEAIPLLIELMRPDSEHAREAAHAFVRITGAGDVWAEAGAPPPASEAELDAEFEEDEPLPEADKAAAWWQANGQRFTPDGRWQGGLEVSDAESVLDRVALQVRRDLYLAARAASQGSSADRELEARVATRAAAR